MLLLPRLGESLLPMEHQGGSLGAHSAPSSSYTAELDEEVFNLELDASSAFEAPSLALPGTTAESSTAHDRQHVVGSKPVPPPKPVRATYALPSGREDGWGNLLGAGRW